jgi:hypothetical protein
MWLALRPVQPQRRGIRALSAATRPQPGRAAAAVQQRGHQNSMLVEQPRRCSHQSSRGAAAAVQRRGHQDRLSGWRGGGGDGLVEGGVAQDAGVVVPADDAFGETVSVVIHSRACG